jgi:hypothetical protein
VFFNIILNLIQLCAFVGLNYRNLNVTRNGKCEKDGLILYISLQVFVEHLQQPNSQFDDNIPSQNLHNIYNEPPKFVTVLAWRLTTRNYTLHNAGHLINTVKCTFNKN